MCKLDDLKRSERNHILNLIELLNNNKEIDKEDCEEAVSILQRIKGCANNNMAIINIITNILTIFNQF